MSLFRQEVVEARSRRVQGEVILTQSMPATLLVFFLVVVISAAGIWLTLGSYARTETARGVLVTSRATVKVLSPRPGVATEVYFKEGDYVQKGAPLALIDADTVNRDGVGAADSSMSALDQQIDLGRSQVALAEQTLHQEQARLAKTVDAARRQIGILRSQKDLQVQVVESQRQLFSQMDRVIERGYVSRAQYEQRRQGMLAAQQTLAGIEQRIAEMEAQVAEGQSRVSALAVARDREVTSIQSTLKGFEQRKSEMSGARSFVVKAPASGRVTAVQTTAGQTVAPTRPMLVIVPLGEPLKAEVYAPTRAIGFVRPGQEARLLYDAFPYQRFGSSKGRVQTISRSILDPRETDIPLKLEEPVYKIVVQLDRQQVAAYGTEHPLQPGMTFTANLVLERRSFLEWLLTPLRAVMNRS